jgi:hypothetical protein
MAALPNSALHDITGYGLSIVLTASTTFPAGLTLTHFADDADPLDISAVKIADTAMGLNGDMVKWSKAIANPMVLNVVPNSSDDVNLAILASANRVSQGSANARDVITAIISYPDGLVIAMNNGFITDAPFGTGVASAGRLKSKTYTFAFGSSTGNT